MCRLIFNLSLTRVDAAGVRTDASEELAGARVEIGGLPVAGRFSWSDFLLTLSDPAAFRALMKADGRSGGAIVYPRQPAEGVTFTVTLPQHPDTVYTFGMDPTLELAACKAYTFDMPLEYYEGGNMPGPEPGVKHTVRYLFEGEANSGNVTVYKENLSTLWPLDEIIRVDDHGVFSFGYESRLSVRIRTASGETIALAPGQLYHFTDITDDVVIIISAAREERMHRVNYIFEGEANASNVKVYKESLYTPWASGEYVTVPEGGNFSFGYLSALEITVRTADGLYYPVTPDRLFTLTDIRTDITLILSGYTQPSTTVYHRITYEYQGRLNTLDVPVKGTADVAYPDWEPNETIFVADGGDFTFRYDKQGYDGEVTVTLDGKVMPDITAGDDYTFRGITRDMHFILYDKKYHTVTVVTNLVDQATDETNTLVVSGDRFEMTLPPGTGLVVKVDGKTIAPAADGRYVIDHVTKDTLIVITNDKGEAEPNLIIKADVHDWEELPVVDGGVITPDKN